MDVMRPMLLLEEQMKENRHSTCTRRKWIMKDRTEEDEVVVWWCGGDCSGCRRLTGSCLSRRRPGMYCEICRGGHEAKSVAKVNAATTAGEQQSREEDSRAEKKIAEQRRR
jgi:hypothetical protein